MERLLAAHADPVLRRHVGVDGVGGRVEQLGVHEGVDVVAGEAAVVHGVERRDGEQLLFGGAGPILFLVREHPRGVANADDGDVALQGAVLGRMDGEGEVLIEVHGESFRLRVNGIPRLLLFA